MGFFNGRRAVHILPIVTRCVPSAFWFVLMRIRTIKPEFWTDSKMVSLPRDARLLFVGLWNASDDHGWMPDDSEQLRMLLFPGDPDFQFEPLLELLIAADRLERHVFDDGKTALRVANWERHQRVDHPAKSKIARESSRKLAIPLQVRRDVATRYNCKPGGSVDVGCYYCETGGKVQWFKLSNGKPSAWVVFPGMELDHFIPESNGGETVASNIVLCCRDCNRAKGTKDGVAFLAKARESSRGLAPEQGTGNREQGKEGDASASPWAVAFDLELPEKLRTQPCLEAVKLWLGYKKEQKQAYKAIGLKAALTKWANEFTADTFPAAVSHSIASGWKGIFSPTANGNHYQPALAAKHPAGDWRNDPNDWRHSL
jgi:hypothetical protein